MATTVGMMEVARHADAQALAAGVALEAHASVAKNLLLFLAAPFIGLAYVIAFPFVGVAAVIMAVVRR